MADHELEAGDGHDGDSEGPEVTSELLAELVSMESRSEAPIVAAAPVLPATAALPEAVSIRRDAIRRAISLVAEEAWPGAENARTDTEARDWKLSGGISLGPVVAVVGVLAGLGLLATSGVGVSVGPLGLGCVVWIVSWMSKQGRLRRARSQQQRALEAISSGPPPILFWRTSERRPEEPMSVDSSEAALVEDFAGVGPLLAIGHTGFVIPLPGAANCFFHTRAWDEAFGVLVESCGIVIMRVGARTDGFEDVRRTLEIVDPECLLLLASGRPGGIHDYLAFVSAHGTLFRRGLPCMGSEDMGSLSNAAFFIGFDSTWHPRVMAAHEAAAHAAAGLTARGMRRTD